MYIHINRQILYYSKHGDGSPVILLHGNGEDSTIFDRLIPRLSGAHTVYAIDSRGHGESNPTDDYHYDGMALDVIEFIKALELERPMLYGFSDGGIVGLLAAIRQPKLLSKLAVSGANLNPKGIRLFERLKIRRHYQKTKSPLELMMLREPDISADALSNIQIPVLVMAGEHDIIKSSHTKKIAMALPHGTLEVVPGEDHGSYVIHSEKLYPYLQKFFG